MRPDLENAILTESELEAIPGVDVNDIGLTLVYRPTFLQNLNQRISFAIASPDGVTFCKQLLRTRNNP